VSVHQLRTPVVHQVYGCTPLSSSLYKRLCEICKLLILLESG
jgi:hypothetical protein